MKLSRIHKKLAATALATFFLGTGSAFAAYENLVAGPQANGTGVTPHGWHLTPAGKQVNLGNKPTNGVISPDHRYLVAANDGRMKSLQVVDLQQQKVVSEFTPSDNHLGFGLAFSPDGNTLYASGLYNNILVFHFENGTLTEQTPIIMKDANNPQTKFSPWGMSMSPDGKFLYVADNLDNSVSIIDLSTGQITAKSSVGINPFAAYLSHDNSTLYVTNWGESSVTVLNAKDLSIKQTINVGLHPNAVAENPVNGLIYISDSDSDQISVIDPKKGMVTQTLSLEPYQGAPTGSQPNALTVSPDGKTLYVSNGGNNDIAVIDISDVSEAKVKGLIPTAWYPQAVYLNEDGTKLMVLNGRGLGEGPNPQHYWDGYPQFIALMVQGTMSFIDVPTDQQLKRYTEQVNDNNKVSDVKGNGWLSRLKGEKDFPIPRFAEQKSPIKHVIYVIRENNTFDTILGDLGKGNGDPSLTFAGWKVTPNTHKLASQFVTLDNFYADGENSADGHDWTTAAKANDYKEKGMRSFDHIYDYQGRDHSNYSKEGHLWNDANRSGVSFRNYGEFMLQAPNGNQWFPTDNTMGNNYDPNYPGWNLQIPDLTRFDEWNKEFQQFVKNDNLPQLETVYLPNDHTEGTDPGYPTPRAMIANNDLALGKLVDTVSHSKYWKDTAIFVVEDDAQSGADHVDAHRIEALVISPYTQTGKVDSTFYDTPSMLRAMELILGMKPMTQFDASAIPMINSFTNHPNFSPYNVEAPQYPIDEMNGPNAPMAEISMKLDFSQPDSADRDKLNRAIWASAKGNQPYPGDKK